MSETIQIKGVEKLQKKLDGIDGSIRRKAIRKGIGEQSKILRKDMKRRVKPHDPGLARSIGQRTLRGAKYSRFGVIGSVVGPRYTFIDKQARNRIIDGEKVKVNTGDMSRPSARANDVEYGGTFKPEKGPVIETPATPFMRPAFSSTKRRMLGVMAKTIRVQLAAAGV